MTGKKRAAQWSGIAPGHERLAEHGRRLLEVANEKAARLRFPVLPSALGGGFVTVMWGRWPWRQEPKP